MSASALRSSTPQSEPDAARVSYSGPPNFGVTPSSFTSTSRLHATARSEEHTSELQSRVDLVCRLLLEKKKKKNKKKNKENILIQAAYRSTDKRFKYRSTIRQYQELT